MSSSVDEKAMDTTSSWLWSCLCYGVVGCQRGLLVWSIRLRELSPQIDRVIVHTDDVPSNYLDAFEKDNLWQLRKVDYIDGVSDLYISKGNIFDGVFTKLGAWTLEEYAKVLLLDFDIIPLKPLDSSLNCLALQQWFVVMEKTFMDRKWMAPKSTRTTHGGNRGESMPV